MEIQNFHHHCKRLILLITQIYLLSTQHRAYVFPILNLGMQVEKCKHVLVMIEQHKINSVSQTWDVIKQYSAQVLNVKLALP